MGGPRILSLDIETAPPAVYTWNFKNAFIGLEQVIAPGFMLGFGWKWHGQQKVGWADMRDREGMVEQARDLMHDADIIVTYNGDGFDFGHLHTAIIQQFLDPPSRYKSVDLYKAVKRKFRFDSHKLDYVAQQLGVGKKASTGGFALWRGCMDGDEAAWAKMARYCKQDVRVTEALYDRLRPWIPGHPNMALYGSGETRCCPACGGHHLQKRGLERTAAATYPRYQCQDCGSWSRGNAIEQRLTGQNRPAV